ncbi:dTDP-4-dehydrorhamnose reductase [Alkalilimnicola ehrlichii MLHE-1]|uniref:dTDP-4-dehydrorhamnose reductase n=1 Tax=Alkalilimnicola ehrlichii (strain ATCC BAA-1101 / DSM 17681 / MLHE-1) TaxID=187272 RepID=Q0A679_ALKEH|nr:dTDP-4-dehydrorhamnose reductase [Alkalilimnicola ehrlichii]ABI57658.1 dTDP-4-dehydrorhamnose reductase [Alkalilimnicola ehrlichii MLHE-1]
MRTLLFGPNGQVGWELRRSLAPLGELIPLGRHEWQGLRGDLTDKDAIAHAIRSLRPDLIVNAAAYTAVDQAESEPEQARLINATAPGVMAELAREQQALFIHYSTDYVFDGSGDRPWHEDDPTAPLNVYGQTKREGEEAVRAADGHHLIFRTAWVYAARGHNFIRTMIRLACQRDTLQVINDQHGAPTGAELIADVTAHAARTASTRPDLRGTYHLTAAGETTWHGYARFVIEQARAGGAPVRVAPEAIEAVATDAFPTVARRPHNSRLDGHKLETTFGLKRPDWRSGVARALQEMDISHTQGRPD